MNGFNPATYNFSCGSPCNNPPYAPVSGGGQHYYDATVAVGMLSSNRYANIFAGVFGTPGFHTVYNNLGVSGNPNSCPGYSWQVVMTLGFGNGNQTPYSPSCQGSSFILDNDNLVYGTLARWGNYDVVHGSVQENLSETASGATLHPGLSNPATTFPASFVFNSTPSWWQFPNGTRAPFPANGPDVTGGVSNLGGHHYANPADSCYHNVMGGKDDGSSGLLTFNADVCYPQTSSSISSVSSSCSPTSITTAQTSACTASVSGSGPFNGNVTWSATNGSITSGGIFTPNPGGAPYTATITATSVQDTTKASSSNVSVTSNISGTITSVTTTCIPNALTLRT